MRAWIPGLCESEADLLVVDRWYRHDAVVDSTRDERLDVSLDGAVAGDAVGVTTWVRDTDELDAREAGKHTSVVAAHHSEPDEAGTQVSHDQAPAFARVFTAVTTLSRSLSESEGWTGMDRHSRAARSVSGRSSSVRNGASRWFGTG